MNVSMNTKQINLLVPLAGIDVFLENGSHVPRSIVMVKNKHIIDWAFESLNTDNCNLIFLLKSSKIQKYNLDKIFRKKFGDDTTIIGIDDDTPGCVYTCLKASEIINNDIPLVIFTSNLFFKHNIILSEMDYSSPFLVIFRSNHKDHSYIKMGKTTGGLDKVVAVVEKEVISDKALLGIYGFSNGKQFIRYANKLIETNRELNNYYLSEVFNLMTADFNINLVKINEIHVHLLRNPLQVDFFRETYLKLFGDKPIALSADHSGYESKELMKVCLDRMKIKYIDYGTYIKCSCDYVDYVSQAVESINKKICDYGIAFCTTGQGVNMCANKFPNVRSALIYDDFAAEYAVKHNAANVFCIPGGHINEDRFMRYLKLWKECRFEGGRHFVRLTKFS